MSEKPTILFEGKHLRFVTRGGWEFVERVGVSGVVAIVPVTADGCLLFTEQYRQPVAASVIEFPAGLVGDEAGQADESPAAAAGRELLEETGYVAASWTYLSRCSTSSGLTSELVTFYLANGLTQYSAGGGTGGERITVHRVPIRDSAAWLGRMESQGRVVSALVFAGLSLLEGHGPERSP